MTAYSREWLQGVDQRFGLRMKELRKAQGMSQQHVALVLTTLHGFDWHQTTTGRVESGARPVRLAEALAIADVLGVKLDALLDDHDPGAGGRVQPQEVLAARLKDATRMHSETSRLHSITADLVEQLRGELAGAARGTDDEHR